MFTKYLKLITLTTILTLILLSGSVALAQNLPVTPGFCTTAEMGTIPGCNPPINVGTTSQEKKSSLSLWGSLLLRSGGGSVKFATDIFPNSLVSQIFHSVGILNIYGGKMPNDPHTSRKVKIWNNLDVVGTTTTGTLVTNNICTAEGSCSPITEIGESNWDNIGDSIYNTNIGNVGIKNTAPSTLLEVGHSAYAGPAYVSVNSATNRVAGFSWKNADTTIWSLFKPNDNSNDLHLNNSAVTSAPSVTVAVFKQGGNVGIGTNAPGTKLDVAGSIRGGSLIIPNLSSSANNVIDLGFGTAGKELNAGKIAYQKWGSGLDIVGAGSLVGSRKVTIYDNLEVLGTTTTNTLVTNNICTAEGSCSPVSEIGGGESFWLKTGNNISNTNTGRVGIGTTNPTTKLDVAGAVRIDYSPTTPTTGYNVWIQGGNTTTAGPDRKLALLGVKSSDKLILNYQGEYTGGVQIQSTTTISAGNVGIGNISPDLFKLQINGNTGPHSDNVYNLGSPTRKWANLYATNVTATNVISTNTTATNVIATNICSVPGSCVSATSLMAGGSKWTTSGTNIYNSNTGRVGVGTNNPLQKFHVQGALRAGGDDTQGNLLLNGGGTYAYLYSYNKPLIIRSHNQQPVYLQAIDSAGTARGLTIQSDGKVTLSAAHTANISGDNDVVTKKHIKITPRRQSGLTLNNNNSFPEFDSTLYQYYSREIDNACEPNERAVSCAAVGHSQTVAGVIAAVIQRVVTGCVPSGESNKVRIMWSSAGTASGGINNVVLRTNCAPK